MNNLNISDLASIINAQIKAHEDLIHRLTHIEALFDFMLAIDFSQAQPAELRAQLLSMSQLVHSAKTMNEALQATLLDKALSQLAGLTKQT